MSRAEGTATLKVVIASLIAATSLVAAVAAWRASLASSAATDADRKAFDDTVAREQARARIRADLAAIVADHMRERQYSLSAAELRRRARAGGPAAPFLLVEAKADEGLAEVAHDAIDQDAIRPDGSLDLARKYAIEYRLAEREDDLDPAPERSASDHAGTKAERLVGLTALLVGAAFFFTLAQVSRRRAYLAYLAAGAVVFVVASALVATVEVVT